MDWSDNDYLDELQRKEKTAILREYRKLLKSLMYEITEDDTEEIRKGFEVALEAHRGVRRKSGELYIFHPLAVARIAKEDIGVDVIGIVCALLHDVVEDSNMTIQDMEDLFGKKVATIIDGLTKISEIFDQNTNLQAENFKKLILTLSQDVRVILIKLADRLHNMRTLGSMREDKSRKIASETMFLYAPLAHRLGLYHIKSEMEDLSLKYLEPTIFNEIKEKLQKSKAVRTRFLNQFSLPIERGLKKAGLKYEIVGRTKSIYSIFQKMRKQNIPFEEVYDILAVRIVIDSNPDNEKADIWKTYSIVTDFYRPNPDRLRDWISTPKSNGYESLHTTVVGPGGRFVEVQVRTERMDEIAEKGYAAHFKYKQGNENESGLESWLNKLKETLETNSLNAVDFVEDFKLNLYSKEIYVFTPKGDLKSLPKDASALDFAFSIHTDVGLKCRGAKVNGKLVPLSYTLKSGDQIEVITTSNNKPNVRWLDFVMAARAKTKIRAALKEEEKLIAEEGKAILTRKLRHLKIAFNEKTINELVTYFKLRTSFDLFFRVGNGAIDNTQLKAFLSQRNSTFINFFKTKLRRTTTNKVQIENKEEVTNKIDALVFGKDEEILDYKLSKCCNPIAGDKVFAFLTIKDGIKIHKKNCPNAISMQSNYAYRIMQAKWIDSTKQDFKVILHISGVDSKGIINNVTRIISNNIGVLIHGINISGNEGIFDGKISLSVKNSSQLNKLIKSIRKVEGVKNVERVNRM
mgnify:CR=1 FL=1